MQCVQVGHQKVLQRKLIPNFTDPQLPNKIKLYINWNILEVQNDSYVKHCTDIPTYQASSTSQVSSQLSPGRRLYGLGAYFVKDNVSCLATGYGTHFHKSRFILENITKMI